MNTQTPPIRRLRAVALVAIMVLSVFAGTVAVSGSAAAGTANQPILESTTPENGSVVTGETTLTFDAESPDGTALEEIQFDVYGPASGSVGNNWVYDDETPPVDRIDFNLPANESVIQEAMDSPETPYPVLDGYNLSTVKNVYGITHLQYEDSTETWSVTINASHSFWSDGEWDWLVVVVDENGDQSAYNNFNAHPGEQDILTVHIDSIQSAIDAASDGDTIEIAPGTYTEALDVTKDDLTFEGQGQVTIDTTPSPDYGIDVRANRTTFRNLDVVGPNDPDTGYGFKISGTGSSGPVSVTIEDVTVENSSRSEIDLNNVRGAVLRNVTADGGDAPKGVGIALSATHDVLLDGVTTKNNPWGGVGLFDYDSGQQRNTSNVTITAASDLQEPNPLYSDQAFGGELGDLYAPGYGYAVENPDHRESTDKRGEDFVYFQQERSDAASFALALENNQSSTVRTLDRDDAGEIDLGPTLVVGSGMSVQTAIDAAEDGEVVEVGDGQHDIGDGLSIPMGTTGLTIRPTDGASPVLIASTTGAERIMDTRGNGTTIRGLTVKGDGGGVGVSVVGQNITVEENTFSNLLTGIQTNSMFENGNATIVSNEVSDATVGISVQNNGNTIEENTLNGSLESLGVGYSEWDQPGGWTVEDNTVRRNKFLGDVGVRAYFNATVDARENYWGAPGGPAGEGAGLGSEATIHANASENASIAFSPWYVDGGLTALSSAAASGDVDATNRTAEVNVSKDTKVNVKLPSGSTAKKITVAETDGPSEGAPDADPNAVYLDISADGTVNGTAEVTVTVNVSRLTNAGIDPQKATLRHFENGSWVELDTEVEVNGGTATLTADVDSFSPFAVTERTPPPSTPAPDYGGGGGDYSPPSTTTEEPTTTTAEPTTTAPPTTTETPETTTQPPTTTTAEPPTTAPPTTTEAPGQPGFGALLALVALLGAALLALRRRRA